MDDMAIELLKVNLEEMQKALATVSKEQKIQHIATTRADEINDTIKQLAAAYPDYAKALPKPIEADLDFGSIAGIESGTYLDLGIIVNRCMAFIRTVRQRK